jgi:hypothetical protein
MRARHGGSIVARLPRPGASVTDDPLLEVLRSGARRMLQQVIEAELEESMAGAGCGTVRNLV